jgi:hypothetical protein
MHLDFTTSAGDPPRTARNPAMAELTKCRKMPSSIHCSLSLNKLGYLIMESFFLI